MSDLPLQFCNKCSLSGFTWMIAERTTVLFEWFPGPIEMEFFPMARFRGDRKKAPLRALSFAEMPS